MIFVTVGTHEQQFDRLVREVDELKASGRISEDVIIQTGYCTYEPKCCQWSKFFPYDQMLEYVKQARIVITHGGPSSFIMPLQVGKIPIVVPRKKEFGEHVNNHQIDFCSTVADRSQSILVIADIDELNRVIASYDKLVTLIPGNLKSNNKRFNNELEKIVEETIR